MTIYFPVRYFRLGLEVPSLYFTKFQPTKNIHKYIITESSSLKSCCCVPIYGLPSRSIARPECISYSSRPTGATLSPRPSLIKTRLTSDNKVSRPTSTLFSRYSSGSSSHHIPLAASLAMVIAFYIDGNKTRAEEMLIAAQHGDSGVIKTLVASGTDVNGRHPFGWTPLHVAAANGHTDCVRALLDAGADPNMGDEFTNAYRASRTRMFYNVEAAEVREQEFSDNLSHRENFFGFTALHYAILFDQKDMVKMLLEAGANPTIISESGQKAVELARKPEMKKLIVEYTVMFETAEREKEADERRRFPLEQRLKQFIVGQEGPIVTVASAIRRKENGWCDDEHPLVFLFLGSSGIGKTELAKQVAAYIHKDKPSGFIRLDMSEYQEKHEVAKLIGSPPGYVGHEKGGQLTQKLKESPNAVVLFDEVDKAHPDVLTVLLQLFDEGRITDGKGNTTSCKNAIFVMTSNLASDEIAQHGLQLRKAAEAIVSERQEGTLGEAQLSGRVTLSRTFKEKVVQPILKKHFRRDEFLGRINEIVYFLPFSRPELMQLVTRELKFWAARAYEKHRVELQWDREVESALADGYNVYYGARSIKYEVDRCVVNRLAAAQEFGLISKGSVVKLVVDWPATDTDSATIKLRVKNADGVFQDVREQDFLAARVKE